VIEVIILAGGRGTRLRGVVNDVPKPMAPIHGKPFLAYQLEALAQKGVNRIILSVGYMSEKITAYFGCTYSGMEIVYVIESQPLGTGGAIKLAMSRCTQDHALVLNGDTYLDYPVEELESLWQGDKRPIIVGIKVNDAERYGKMRLSYDFKRVEGFEEKGLAGPGIINAGCYVIPVNFLSNYPDEVFSYEENILPNTVTKETVDFLLAKDYFIDIGIPSDYNNFINYIGNNI
jgi:D-glycero-alpha-D-manno-heptose 1-phosphate guanylyltransferase